VKGWATRPAVLAAAIVALAFAGGVVYALVTGRSSSGIEDNKRAIAAAGAYPGAQKLGSLSTAGFPENGLPVPRGLVTTVAYRPPPATTQVEVVDFYLSRLREGWTPRLETSLATAGETRSYRVTFSSADECLVLATAGLAAVVESERAYTLSAYAADGGRC
jgi:hypothetical protein